MVTVSEWYEADFLSKIPHYRNGRLYLTRDYSKRLIQGVSYGGPQRLLLRHDFLYQYALLQGLKTEKASRLLEDLTALEASFTPKEIEKIDKLLATMKIDAITYSLGRQEGYLVEEEINARHGIGIGTLWTAWKSKTYGVCFGSVPALCNNNEISSAREEQEPAC